MVAFIDELIIRFKTACIKQAAWDLGDFVFKSRDLPTMFVTTEKDGNLRKKNMTKYQGVGRKKVGIFLWRHTSAGKRGESSVNQAVVNNGVDQNFVLVGI